MVKYATVLLPTMLWKKHDDSEIRKNRRNRKHKNMARKTRTLQQTSTILVRMKNLLSSIND